MTTIKGRDPAYTDVLQVGNILTVAAQAASSAKVRLQADGGAVAGFVVAAGASGSFGPYLVPQRFWVDALAGTVDISESVSTSSSLPLANVSLSASGAVAGLIGPDGTTIALGGGGSIPFVSNMPALGLPRAAAAFARVKRGTAAGFAAANATVLYIGDSTGRGLGSNFTAGGSTGAVSAAPATVICSDLRGVGIPAYAESFFGTGINQGVVTPANYTLQDPRVTFAGSITSSGALGHMPLAGGFWNVPAGAATFSLLPAAHQCDTFDVWCLTNPVYGTYTVNVNGGSTLATIDAGIATSFLKTTVSTTLGANTCNVVRASLSGSFVGIVGRNSAVPEISFYNISAGSSKPADWADAGAYYTAYNGITAMAPDFSIIELLINAAKLTAGVSGETLAAYTANLGTLVDKCLETGDVVMVTGNPISISGGSFATPLATQQAYVAAFVAVAVAKGVPYIDNFSRFVSYEISAAAPYSMYQATEYVHPNAAGCSFKTPPLTALLRSLW